MCAREHFLTCGATMWIHMVVKTDWLGRGLKAPRRILSKFSLFTVVYQNDFQFPILQKRLKEMAGEDSDTDDGNRKVSSFFFFCMKWRLSPSPPIRKTQTSTCKPVPCEIKVFSTLFLFGERREGTMFLVVSHLAEREGKFLSRRLTNFAHAQCLKYDYYSLENSPKKARALIG